MRRYLPSGGTPGNSKRVLPLRRTDFQKAESTSCNVTFTPDGSDDSPGDGVTRPAIVLDPAGAVSLRAGSASSDIIKRAAGSLVRPVADVFPG
jgi:hypothetical protein